jgi:chromosomal replication initiation ATPase DnaA
MGRTKAARKVAIYVMKTYSGLSNREMAEQFGGLHYSAVKKTCTRLELEMKGDRELRKVI